MRALKSRPGRITGIVVGVAAVSLAAAACGSGSSGGSGNGSGGEPTFTIAYQGPLSGGNAQLGLNMANAVKLAINQANSGTSQWGKLPFKLAYSGQDDQGTSTGAPAAVAKILQISNLIAVVGPAFSGATAASEPTYSKAGVATVSPSATLPSLATSGWHNFFRVVSDDNTQGPADAAYIGKVAKDKKVYVVDDASAYGQGLSKAFIGAAPSDGLTVVKHDTTPGTTQCQAGNGNVQQYGPEAQKIAQSGADALFYAGYYCDLALLAKQLRGANYKGLIVSDDGANDPNYIKQAGASVAEGSVLSCACQEVITGSAFQSFAQGYKGVAGGAAPGTYSAEAYDATNAIIQVMKQYGTKVTKADIINGLHSPTFSYTGLSKTVKFTSNGNYAGQAVYMYQVKNGNIDELGLISKLTGGA